MSILLEPDFFEEAATLRGFFDQQFADPREAHENRFAWDYWHIDNQYTLVRTPAYHYFPQELYQEFEDHLIDWGKTNLGCANISPPWLSYYVEGCKQELHADNPHGPWAFVYSLTPWQDRLFEGGETFIAKPQMLDYWKNDFSERGFEKEDLIQEIEPHFNQLLTFDPRFPHGVREVRGERDPRRARLVIHGWFTEPTPYVDGEVDDEDISDFLNQCLEDIFTEGSSFAQFKGHCCLRFNLNSSGEVQECEIISHTFELQDKTHDLLTEFRAKATSNLSGFKDLKDISVTLPLFFQ